MHSRHSDTLPGKMAPRSIQCLVCHQGHLTRSERSHRPEIASQAHKREGTQFITWTADHMCPIQPIYDSCNCQADQEGLRQGASAASDAKNRSAVIRRPHLTVHGKDSGRQPGAANLHPRLRHPRSWAVLGCRWETVKHQSLAGNDTRWVRLMRDATWGFRSMGAPRSGKCGCGRLTVDADAR